MPKPLIRKSIQKRTNSVVFYLRAHAIQSMPEFSSIAKLGSANRTPICAPKDLWLSFNDRG